MQKNRRHKRYQEYFGFSKKLEVKIEKFKDSWNTLEGLIDKIVTARNEVNKKVRSIEIERNKFDDIETDE